MAALLVAFHEYFWVGEFFALRDIMHHEVIEMTLVTFGVGVFSANLGLVVSKLVKKGEHEHYPIPMSVQPSQTPPFKPQTQLQHTT